MIIARVADPVRRRRGRAVRPGHRAAGGRMAARPHGPARGAGRRRPRGAIAARPATVGDFDILVGRVATFARLNSAQRTAFLSDATVREVPAGARVIAQGDEATVRVLHPRGRGGGRHPGRRGRLSRPVDDERGRLLRRDRRPHRQHADRGRRRDPAVDPDGGPRRLAAGRDGGPRGQQPHALDAHRAAAADATSPTCRASRRWTRPRCATCGRRRRRSRRCPRPTPRADDASPSRRCRSRPDVVPRRPAPARHPGLRHARGP